jgi:hypothetical protein
MQFGMKRIILLAMIIVLVLTIITAIGNHCIMNSIINDANRTWPSLSPITLRYESIRFNAEHFIVVRYNMKYGVNVRLAPRPGVEYWIRQMKIRFDH